MENDTRPFRPGYHIAGFQLDRFLVRLTRGQRGCPDMPKAAPNG